MKKTKQKILASALQLFNQHGIADVSIRQIAKECGISHGNLIYHFKTRAEIVQGLHDQLFAHAIQINQDIDVDQFDIRQLFQATRDGFEVVYDYRFFFYDLLYISKTIPPLREVLIQIEKVRAEMYRKVISLSVKHKLLRKAEYDGEYEQLIQRIKIFSDHWISSAAIYEDKSRDQIIQEYARLFMGHFYPYLTKKGKEGYWDR